MVWVYIGPVTSGCGCEMTGNMVVSDLAKYLRKKETVY